MSGKLHADWLSWPEVKALAAVFAPGSFRFVGGAVRDAVLGRAVSEVDAATILTPDAVMALLQKAGIRVIPTGIAHGTVTAMVSGVGFEITTLRNDVACDGRHADVIFTTDWKADAGRRDFTFNAMYVSPEGELFDYYGGEADAKAGRVVFIGDAAARIAEDYLRILRFFRFHAYYGRGPADAGAVQACADAAGNMAQLSGERVQAEILKLLAAPKACETFSVMQRHGILQAALGVEADAGMLVSLEAVEQGMEQKMPAALRLAGLVWHVPELVDVLVRRLRLSNKVEKNLRGLLRYKAELSGTITVLEQKRLLRRMGAELFHALVLLSWAAHGAKGADAPAYLAMLALAGEWQAPEFPVTGDDLIAHGVEPGKSLGERLRHLEEAWELSDYVLDRVQLLQMLQRII